MNEIRAKERLKAKRKLKRKQLLLLKQEPYLSAYFTGDTTEHLFVANCGKLNGVSRELLSTLCDGLAETIIMLEEKDYCFVTCNSCQASLSLAEKLNGISVQEECEKRGILHMLAPAIAAGLPLRLYIGFMTNIPDIVAHQYPSPTPLPPGLILKPEYITSEQERTLLAFFKFRENIPADQMQSRDASTMAGELVDAVQTDSGSGHKSSSAEDCIANEMSYVPPEASLKLRRVKHYGYEFMYGSNSVDINKPLPGGLPAVCGPLLKQIVDDGLVCSIPDQLTVNEYLPGAGIPPHIDTHSAFEDGIISTVMDFADPDRRKVSVFVPPRSLLIMKGESRYLWSHGIVARKFDSVHPNMAGYSFHDTRCSETDATRTSCADSALPDSGGGTVLHRGVRSSLTFRKVRNKPCDCS
eukprot:Em0022g164a